MTDEDKRSLIDLIKWYRDHYHHSDFCHTDMIAELRDPATPQTRLDDIEWQVDSWIDP